MIKRFNANKARLRRHQRVRKRVHGTTARPRLCVFRSAEHIYAQIIDDEHGRTLVAASSLESAKGEKKQPAGKGATKAAPKSQAGAKAAPEAKAEAPAGKGGKGGKGAAAPTPAPETAEVAEDEGTAGLKGIADNHKVAQARSVGRLVAERAKDQGITQVVFDRGGYIYHGRVAALAAGAREGGLDF
jgi:large subunit ribosomal protein L18